MEDNSYFSRAWGLLTRDKGWAKPLLVMMCSSLVPVVGDLGNRGYGLEWARLTAWGVDASPKQKNVDVGGCIVSGWRGFLVELGWSLLLGLVYFMLLGMSSVMPGFIGELISFTVGMLFGLASILWRCVTQVAEIRAAIYERAGAGYRFDRVFEMVKRDRGGFGRVFAISLVASLLMFAIGVALGIVLVLELTPAILVGGYMGGSSTVLSAISGSLVWLALTTAIAGFAISFVANAIRLLTLTATALWMRQFDVANWGRSEDPLPQSNMPVDDAMPSSPMSVTPVQNVAAKEPETATDKPAQHLLSEMMTENTSVTSDEGFDAQAAEELYAALSKEAHDAPIDERSVDELLSDLDKIAPTEGGEQ